MFLVVGVSSWVGLALCLTSTMSTTNLLLTGQQGDIMKLNVPTIDMELATDGKWFKYTDTISFKVARDGNPQHKRAIQNKFKAINKYRERGEVDRIERINNELMARCIIRDWEGLEEEGVGPVPYSYETALSIISDPAYLGIKEFIVDCSSAAEEFDEQEEVDIVKN